MYLKMNAFAAVEMRVQGDMQECEEQKMQLKLSRLVLCGKCTRTG